MERGSFAWKRNELNSSIDSSFWDSHTIFQNLKLFLIGMNYLQAPSANGAAGAHESSGRMLPVDSYVETSLTASTTTIKHVSSGVWDKMIRNYSFTSVQEWENHSTTMTSCTLQNEPVPPCSADPSSPENCTLQRLESTVLRIHLGQLSNTTSRSAPNETQDLYSSFVPLVCDIIARYKGSITSLCASFIECVWPIEKKTEVLQVCECVFEMRRHLAKQRNGKFFKDNVIFTMRTCESLYGPIEMRQNTQHSLNSAANGGVPSNALSQHLIHKDYILTTDHCHEMHQVLKFMATSSASFFTMDYPSYLLCNRKFICRQIDYIRLDHSAERECIFDCVAKKDINETQEWFYLLKSEQQEDTWRVYNLAWKQITLGRYKLASKALNEFQSEVEARGAMMCSQEQRFKNSVQFLKSIVDEGLQRLSKGDTNWQYVRNIVSFHTEPESSISV
eukprot:CAMPEP_0117451664 /NCGR_PEP_ID=MMETSP0759-20121206/9136_1 /TAXON_ID=63605 /ORGANISM="Percolomonas cosmopolitus, Strain WS" /LENGTH=447 /DNA_ID=CAMNT_0005244295 /DNA_START=637 /DNA_END=1980 /DNA_ORIENTATION=-